MVNDNTRCYKVDLLMTGIFPLAMEPSPCWNRGRNDMYTGMSRVKNATQDEHRLQVPIKSTNAQAVKTST